MKRSLLSCLLFGCAFGLNLIAQSVAAKTLYDDFAADFIDNNKWNQVEFVREITDGNLVSRVANTSYNPTARNVTSFQQPSSINVIQSSIIVAAINIDTGINSSSFARICGRFYNKLASPTTEKGDIWAAVYVGNRGNGMEAWWVVSEALDDEGDSWNEIQNGSLASGLSEGNSYIAKIDYDGGNGFTFTAAGVSSTFNGPARGDAEFLSFKALETGAHGSSGNGYISVLFDNVLVNNLSYDDFSAAPLDQSRWSSDEQIREIANGKLRLNILGFNDQSQISMYLTEYDVPYIEAKVRIESSSQLSLGARGIARIQGYYYNDSRGPGSGIDYNHYEGDVFAEIRIQMEDNRDLKAMANVGRAVDANQTSFTQLFMREFSTPVNFDKDYTLSIGQSGSMLVFKCNNETLVYNISTPMYTPFGKHRGLRSRVYLDQGEYGYIKAQFDDVYVDMEQTQATYDASGKWKYSTFNSWDNCPGETPEPDETGTVTITQSGNTFTIDDSEGNTQTGTISGPTYSFTTSYPESAPDSTPGTVTDIHVFTLSSAASGLGTYTGTWVADDMSFTCSWGNEFKLEKSDGGGGGCLIDTLRYR